MGNEKTDEEIQEFKNGIANSYPLLPTIISKDDAKLSMAYIEGFINGIFKAHGDDPMCKRQIDILWNYIDGRKIKLSIPE